MCLSATHMHKLSLNRRCFILLMKLISMFALFFCYLLSKEVMFSAVLVCLSVCL